jgi:hypothetical protein
MIFHLVHQESGEMLLSLPVEWHADEVLLSPSRFPHALASVTPHWREIMSLVPAFWKTVIIIVDASQGINLPEIEVGWKKILMFLLQDNLGPQFCLLAKSREYWHLLYPSC